MILSQQQILFYQTNGYLILDDFFSTADLLDFKEAYREIIMANLKNVQKKHSLPWAASDYIGREFDAGMDALEAVDHKYVADIYDLSCQIPAFFRILGKRELSASINQLLNRQAHLPLYCYTNRCRIDPPFDERRTTCWHQEIFYTVPQSSFIQTWAPLIRDTTIENGAIEICVGSHRQGIVPQSWNEIPGRALQIAVDDEYVNKYEPKSMPMKLGQLLLFSQYLFHRSGKNVSKEYR